MYLDVAHTFSYIFSDRGYFHICAFCLCVQSEKDKLEKMFETNLTTGDRMFWPLKSACL